MRSFLRCIGTALFFVLLDQITKACAVAYLKPIQSKEIIPGFFNLAYVENTGAAWGMLAGKQWFLIGFTVIAIAWLLWKRKAIFGSLPLSHFLPGMLLGGIVGNLIDRISTGRVIDFLDFHWGTSHFPAFNVADSAICCGVFLFLLLQWRADAAEKKQISSNPS